MQTELENSAPIHIELVCLWRYRYAIDFPPSAAINMQLNGLQESRALNIECFFGLGTTECIR